MLIIYKCHAFQKQLENDLPVGLFLVELSLRHSTSFSSSRTAVKGLEFMAASISNIKAVCNSILVKQPLLTVLRSADFTDLTNLSHQPLLQGAPGTMNSHLRLQEARCDKTDAAPPNVRALSEYITHGTLRLAQNRGILDSIPSRIPWQKRRKANKKSDNDNESVNSKCKALVTAHVNKRMYSLCPD